MTETFTPEIYWLTLTLLMTALLWIPYIIELIARLGPAQALWDPYGVHSGGAAWALRAKKAHYNAIENLIIFAPLVILIHIFDLGTPMTALAAMVYFFARLSHYFIYLFAIPILRTVAFLICFMCQIILALTILGWI